MTGQLSGRSAIITGANQGLGKAIARAFIEAGANVLLCARDMTLLEQTRDELAPLAHADQKVIIQRCDVSNAAEVDQLVVTAIDQFGTFQILVNNAGVYGPKGLSESVDWAEWTRAIEINLYGTALPIRAVLPHFRAANYGKIINLSGGGATNPLPRFSAYAASKAAVVRFTETIAVEMQELAAKIDVNAVAPGALNTRLLDEVLEAGPDAVGAQFYQRAQVQKKTGGTSPEKGANLCVYLASAASDGISGRLISAVWDPWETLADHNDDMKDSDIYMLRRIVPKDRGQNWGDR
ncbi:MAG: SDR family oxidoreductase [Anaerolineae bacterium]